MTRRSYIVGLLTALIVGGIAGWGISTAFEETPQPSFTTTLPIAVDQPTVVPKLTGLRVDEAIRLAAQWGLDPAVVKGYIDRPEAKVTVQDPPPGKTVTVGDTISMKTFG